jgi:hypothetical protein
MRQAHMPIDTQQATGPMKSVEVPDGAAAVSTSQGRREDGASRPRARARSTASVRLCASSFSYRRRRWVRTVFADSVSSDTQPRKLLL